MIRKAFAMQVNADAHVEYQRIDNNLPTVRHVAAARTV